MIKLFREQPRAFYMIFMLEVWERFGYYTVQGILTLYFIRELDFDESIAFYTFGAFSALVYALVVIGGYLGDKVLGTKRTIVLGLFTLAFGYLSLALADKAHVFLALGLICVGNGLFKANPSNLLSKCYKKNDVRLHGGFTLYYMAVNIGSIAALFVGPMMAHAYGYPVAYFLSFIGLMLGLANYYFQKHHLRDIKTPADSNQLYLWHWNFIVIAIIMTTESCAYLLQHVMIAKNLVWIVIMMVVMTYIYYLMRERAIIRLKMIVAFILMCQGVVFFVLYQQMPTSLNLFAVNNVSPQLFGMPIDPQSFQALNPIWIIILSPILAYLYQWLSKKNINISMPYKFSLGMGICGMGFLILFMSRFYADEFGIVSSWWLVASYALQSVGELLVSALGVAMVAELVPASIAGFVMGMWFLTAAAAAFIGAYVASFTAIPVHIQGVEALDIYTSVFKKIGITACLLAIIMYLLGPFLNRMIKTEKVG